MSVPPAFVAALVAIAATAVVALNFYASARAERRHLPPGAHSPHWQEEAGIDLIAGLAVAVAAVVLIAAVLR
ncbi:MAG: hypothetical protein ACREPI_10965 [Candidatus Dormibacterales bacterium]